MQIQRYFLVLLPMLFFHIFIKTDSISSLYLIDTITAVVFGAEDTSIITKSDINRPALDGAIRSLDDIIFEKLVFQDAKKYKMLPDEDAIDKHLKAVQRENNLSFDQLKDIFKSAGYSYDEGREQFGIMSAVSSVLDFKIRSRLIVPEKDIIAYCNAHPEIEEASYQLQRTVIPFAVTQNKEEQKKEIIAGTKNGNEPAGLEWSPAFWINRSDIADNKKFIVALKIHELSEPNELKEGFELFKKIDEKEERTRSLEERYRDIADILRRPKYEELFANYKKEMFDIASILYFDDSTVKW